MDNNKNHISIERHPEWVVKAFVPLLLLLCLLLTSCETSLSNNDDKDSLNSESSLTREENNLTLPPSLKNQSAPSPRQKLEGMKGLKGVNVDQLFSQNIRDTDRRFDRLENVVTDFRREYESVKPEILRLVAIEKDMQKLIELLNADAGVPAQSPEFTSAQQDPMSTTPVDISPPSIEGNAATAQDTTATVAPVKQEMAPPPAPAISSPPPPPIETPTKQEMSKADHSGIMLKNFRFGEHSDYVRMVIDANTKTSYKLDLDPSGEIMTITVPSSSWTGAETKTFKYNDHLDSYRAKTDPQTKETIIYVSFKKPVKVINQGTLKSSTPPKFRIFIDVN